MLGAEVGARGGGVLYPGVGRKRRSNVHFAELSYKQWSTKKLGNRWIGRRAGLSLGRPHDGNPSVACAHGSTVQRVWFDRIGLRSIMNTLFSAMWISSRGTSGKE